VRTFGFVFFACVFLVALSCKRSNSFEELIDDTRQEIQERMQEYQIPGAAVAVFDRERTLWLECFGVLGTDSKSPVTPETSFSIMSASKMVTATAVMMAVQNGRLDLDTPITEYLPTFTVNSVHEKTPEQKITLRDLLSHTAGFDGEAAGGNNAIAGTLPFTEYAQTIRDTWLLVPVGARYLYSNISIDVAGEVLQEVLDRPFAEVIEDDLFQPLGMSRSFVDTPDMNAASDGVAHGHSEDFSALPSYFPISASGGVRMSIEDAIRFAQFHMNYGQVGGKTLLRKEFLDQMHARTVRVADWGDTTWYGLGSYSFREASTYAVMHYGGGFGFRYSMKWYPEYGIGVILMLNEGSRNHIDWEVTQDFLKEMVEQKLVSKLKDERVVSMDQFLRNTPKSPLSDSIYEGFLEPTPFRIEWRRYLGRYRKVFGGGFKPADATKQGEGYVEPDVFLMEKNGYLWVQIGDDAENAERVYEHQSGLFFLERNLIPIDLRNDPPRIQNLEFEKIE